MSKDLTSYRSSDHLSVRTNRGSVKASGGVAGAVAVGGLALLGFLVGSKYR